MSNWIATLLGAALIAVAIFGSQFVPRHQIAPAVDASGNPFAWRVNIRTGEVYSCHFVRGDDPFAVIADPKRTFMSIGCYEELPKR